jgi:hypothetical protein
MFHDFTIDAATLDIIRSQSGKLVYFCQSMDIWKSSSYAEILPVVNSETLQLLGKMWHKYLNSSTSKCATYDAFYAASRKVYAEHNRDSNSSFFHRPLSRSFGMFLTHEIARADKLIAEFWKHGVSDVNDFPKDPICNPLFVYSSIAGDRFAMSPDTSPLTCFHLDSIILELMGESRHQLSDDAETNLRKVVDGAKSQFKNWCTAFQKVATEKPKPDCQIVIRLVVADPIAFCCALYERSVPNVELLANFSNVWSGTPLVLDNDIYPTDSEISAPLEFNVIDTNGVVDHVGPLTVLIATVPLLYHSPASAIYMEIGACSRAEEIGLLWSLISGDPLFLCSVLGVAPLGFLTGISTRGLLQDMGSIRDEPYSMLTRLVWKSPASGDDRADPTQMRLSISTDVLVSVLKLVYTTLFEHEEELLFGIKAKLRSPITPPNMYTRSSFAAFVAFMKRRFCAPWETAVDSFMEKVLNRFEPPVLTLARRVAPTVVDEGRLFLTDLVMQMHYHGVHRTGLFLDIESPDIIPALRNILSKDRHTTGLLGLACPPSVICIVLTVPRSRIEPIYRKAFREMKDVDCIFHARIHYAHDCYIVQASPIPVFGKLVMDEDGFHCQIEKDDDGWHGQSDMHICLCVATQSLLCFSPLQIKISLNMYPNARAKSLFHDHYGKELEVFKSALLDETNIRLVKSIPGQAVPNPFIVPSPLATDELNGVISRTPTTIAVQCHKTKFSTRLTLLTESDRNALANGANVKATLTSPCVITIEILALKYECRFPFPVNGDATILRVSRKSGWIDVTAACSIATQDEGGYASDFLPVVRDIGSGLVCSWNLPFINFAQLPRIKDLSPLAPWFQAHFDQAFSDRERTIRHPGSMLQKFKEPLTALFKALTSRMAGRVTNVCGISLYSRIPELYFYVTGIYLDPDSHSLVAEAYVFEAVPEFVQFHSNQPVFGAGGTVQIHKVDAALMEAWKSAVPSMVERCRNWEHTETCEYQNGIPAVGNRVLCSCGMGKVGPEFLAVKAWQGLAPYVTRCALSPLFPVPYIEEARQQGLKILGNSVAQQKMARLPEWAAQMARNEKACRVCEAVEKTKKCSGCEKVYYCGRECQRADWKAHKSSCRQEKAAV